MSEKDPSKLSDEFYKIENPEYTDLWINNKSLLIRNCLEKKFKIPWFKKALMTCGKGSIVYLDRFDGNDINDIVALHLNKLKRRFA